MKIETKYNVGDVVWFIHDNKVKSDKIMLIKLCIRANDKNDIQYRMESYKNSDIDKQPNHVVSNDFFERNIFPSKQALLDSL